MIGDYKLKESETHRAVKYSLSTTNLALNGLCDHQEHKTKMTVQWRVHVCVCLSLCVYVWRRTVFTWVPFLLYVCLMAYECFHGNNDSLSWLDGPTYGQQQRGDRVQVTIFGCGGIFISYLHSRKCPWCEMTFIIYSSCNKDKRSACVCVCSRLHTKVCARVRVIDST